MLGSVRLLKLRSTVGEYESCKYIKIRRGVTVGRLSQS